MCGGPEESAGLYIHVPFCVSKCGYCDFYSLPGNQAYYERYLALICRMLETFPAGRQRFSTLYFGGGTPSLLGERGLAQILEAAARYHSLSKEEITVECNPGTVDASFFQSIKNSGVTRISLGVQSFCDDQLRLLGRQHTAQQARRAVWDAQRAGFSNISLDLMLGLPGQGEKALYHTLCACRELSPTHISAYLLKIEEGTPFFKNSMIKRCPPEEAVCDLYLQTVAQLAQWGFSQYEISNFAAPGFESRHNLLYWSLSPYLGLGPAAHSFFGGRRRYFERDFFALLNEQNPYLLWRDDGAGGDFNEYAMLRLRLSAGLDLAAARALYQLDTAPLVDRAQPMLTNGLATLKGERLALTPRGFLLSNTIIACLLRDY